jgi:hypothetical protein
MATVHAPADCAMPAAICGCPLPMAHPRGICIVLHLLQHQLSPAIVKKRLRHPHGSAPSPPPRATPPASLSLPLRRELLERLGGWISPDWRWALLAESRRRS